MPQANRTIQSFLSSMIRPREFLSLSLQASVVQRLEVCFRSLLSSKMKLSLCSICTHTNHSTDIQSINIPSLGSTVPGRSQLDGSALPKGAIAGIAVGGLAGLVLLGIATAWIIRRRRHALKQWLLRTRADPIFASNSSLLTPSDSYISEVVKIDPFVDEKRNSAPTYYTDDRMHYHALPVPHSAIMSSSSLPRSTTDFDGTRIFFGASDLQFSSTAPPIPESAVIGSGSDTNTTDIMLIARSTFLNSEMRNEIENLRRDVDRMRAEAALNSMMLPPPTSPRTDVAPPQYVSLVGGSQVTRSQVGSSRPAGSTVGASQVGSISIPKMTVSGGNRRRLQKR